MKVANASAPAPRRMISLRAWLTTRPGRPIKWKRRAFIRFVTQPFPSTSRFIAAFRFNARIISVHQAALAPNSPDGSCPPARSDFIALAAPLTQPPDDLIGRVVPVGHDTEQFVNALLTKRLRREWQVRLIAQCQLTQWFTDRQKPVIRPLPAVPGPGWHIADLGILLI